jgi:8-oxo-dGTP diphosphatase
MMNKGRAQCLIIRGNKILMVKHNQDGNEYFCLPGGGIEEGETPDEAAVRELKEECLVIGDNLHLISSVIHDNHFNYTFYAEIGNQEPNLGVDPEVIGEPILISVEWRTLESICERDRAYLWAAGLFYVDYFAKELDSWDDDIKYPSKRVKQKC